VYVILELFRYLSNIVTSVLLNSSYDSFDLILLRLMLFVFSSVVSCWQKCSLIYVTLSEFLLLNIVNYITLYVENTCLKSVESSVQSFKREYWSCMSNNLIYASAVTDVSKFYSFWRQTSCWDPAVTSDYDVFSTSDVNDAADDSEYWQMISQICNLVILLMILT
jgi:hypothetical protein